VDDVLADLQPDYSFETRELPQLLAMLAPFGFSRLCLLLKDHQVNQHGAQC